MYFYNFINFHASLNFEFKDPMVGQKLKATIFVAENENKTDYDNWTFIDKYKWDDFYYSNLRLLNSVYMTIG